MAGLLIASVVRVLVMLVAPVALVACTQVLGALLADAAVRWVGLPAWLTAAMSWLGGGPTGTNYQTVV